MLRDLLNDIKEDSFGEAVTWVALLIMLIVCIVIIIWGTIYLIAIYPFSILAIIGVVLGLVSITWLIRRYG